MITNDTVNANDTVTLNGTAQANSTIHVLNGSDVLGSTTASANGSWSFTTGELTAGSYTFTATATDAAGSTSVVSSGIDPTIGLPAAPAIVSFSPDSGPAGADATNAQILTLTGTASAASTVEVFDGQTELGTTTANAAGAWSYTTGTLADGAHSFTATDTVAVNVSAASAALTVTVDTIAPATPQIVNDTVNANDSVTLSGTAQANTTVEVFAGIIEHRPLLFGGTIDTLSPLGSATVNGNGTWTYTTGPLANGTQNFTATDTDAAGNVSGDSATFTVVVDTTTPAAPVITNDTVNANDTVTLNGTAEANSTIHVLNGTDVLGSATANASGSWSFTTGELTAGSYTFTATATDAAGNTSAVSSGIDPTIGLPAAPAIVSFSPDSGPAGADITNAQILTLTGTAPAASTVEVFDGSTELGTTTANAAGTWSYTTGTLADGAHSFTATDTVAVNVSAASAALTVTVDTIAPAAPQIVNDTVNANDSVTLSGTAAANSTLDVFDGSTELGTTTTNGSGAWSYTTGTLGSGAHSFTATDTDVAGNVSAASAAVTADCGKRRASRPHYRERYRQRERYRHTRWHRRGQ